MKHGYNKLAGMELLAQCSKETVADEQVVDIGLAYRAAMLAFRSGRGDVNHWSTLAYCLNVAMILAEDCDVMPEGLSAIYGGQDALIIVRDIGQFRLGHHAFAINSALEIFRRQLDCAPRGKVGAAIKEVERRNAEGRRV